ncbi:Dyp-type peroxidase family [Ceratobasidium sp. AG-Ba]|nr:Dyp-type peroxidase family [Ceratobasidium sp. AG-Ba]QRW06214.1 Dyp-type peroxidase family [Ceratobasidium sp. AG-Ba]
MSENGFRFIQIKWSNAPTFAPTKKIDDIGYDPIIGQVNGGKRTTMGTQKGPLLTLLDEFVITQGGEYFFTPSIKALHSVFVGKPYPE